MLLACDVDGTLETSMGPVQISRLKDLQERGWTIVIVSESGNFPKDESGKPTFPRIVERGSRTNNLRAVRATFPGHEFYLYVSDNPGDEVLAGQAGFAYIHPAQFR